MRSVAVAGLSIALLAIGGDARAVPPMVGIDHGRTADFWLELTSGPFASRGDAPVLPRLNPFSFLRPLGASRPTRGFYLFGSDALHVVPRRVGFWGWGLMAGGEF